MSGLFSTLSARSFKKAETTKPMTQAEKVRKLAGLILIFLYRDGVCALDALLAAAREAGLSGRIGLQLGAGVGGEGGMRLFRKKDKGVLCCADNVVNLVTCLGEAAFEAWLQENEITPEAFDEWLNRQPSVN